MRRVHITYSNFALELHGGVDLKWSGGLLNCFVLKLIVVRVKVSRGFEPFSPMGNRGKTVRTAHWEIYMDISH
jgi:hypothetical protein